MRHCSIIIAVPNMASGIVHHNGGTSCVCTKSGFWDCKSALHGLPTTMEHLVSVSRLAPRTMVEHLCVYTKQGFYFPGR